MWFRFGIFTTKSHYIAFTLFIFVSNFFKALQNEINYNTMPSIEAFIDDLNEKNNDFQTTNKTVPEQKDIYKKLQLQNVPSNVVLMMKLISYYEDKFKVANHEPTERGTTSSSVRIENKKNTLNNDHRAMQRVGFSPKDRYNGNLLIPEVIIA